MYSHNQFARFYGYFNELQKKTSQTKRVVTPRQNSEQSIDKENRSDWLHSIENECVQRKAALNKNNYVNGPDEEEQQQQQPIGTQNEDALDSVVMKPKMMRQRVYSHNNFTFRIGEAKAKPPAQTSRFDDRSSFVSFE